MVQLLAYELWVGGLETVEFHGIAVRAVAVQLHTGLEMLHVRGYALDFGVVLLHGGQNGVQLIAARRLAAHCR